jgi:hypothetical protein
MSVCDYCLSGCSDDGHSLGDEGCDPSRECFHVDQGDHDEDNHLGMPQDDNAPMPASCVDIPWELAVAPVPAGGQDTQLEQFREMQAKLDEEAGRLVQLRPNIEKKWAGRALAGGAPHQAQDVQRRIVDDARARLPPAVSGVGQNLAAAAMLLRTMSEPSTTEGRRIQGELKGLLENAAVRRAESSASRRQACPSEHRTTSSRLMQEASVRTGRTRDGTPTAPDRLSDEHHRRDLRALLTRRCAEATTPGAEDATTVRRTGAPRPNCQGRGSSAGPYDGRRFQPGSEPQQPSPSTQGKQGRSCGLRITDWRASWEGRMTTTSSSATSPFSSPTLPAHGWSICLLCRSLTGMTWSRPSRETSKVRTCALGTHGTSEAAASSQGNPYESTSDGFQSSAPSCPTSPTWTSSERSSPTPCAGTW